HLEGRGGGREISHPRGRLSAGFGKVDKSGAAWTRQGSKPHARGKASCNISISPTVSEVTRPTRRPLPSTTATAGADFSCNIRHASSRQRRGPIVGTGVVLPSATPRAGPSVLGRRSRSPRPRRPAG